MSIKFKLSFLYSCIFAISFLLIFFILYCLVSAYLQKNRDEWIQDETKELQKLVSNVKISDKELDVAIGEEAIAAGTDYIFYCLRSQDGKALLYSNPNSWRGVLESKQDFPWQQGRKPFFRTMEVEGNKYPIRVLYYPDPSGRILEVAISLKNDVLFLKHLVYLFVITYVFLIAICWFVGFLIVKNTLHPVQTMTEFARKVAISNISERIPIKVPVDELDELAITFNGMLERIDGLITTIKEVNDNLAHNIRSPIGRIRINAQIALLKERSAKEYQEVLTNCLDECVRLLDMSNTMLDISEAEARILTIEKLDLASLLRETVEIFMDIVQQQDIELTSEIATPILICGNYKKLKQVLINVLDNAVKYTNSDGKIKVMTFLDAKNITIKISNTGMGIDAEEIPYIFKKFYRSETCRSLPGVGLGLPFVKAVVEAHKGSVMVESKKGECSTFSIILPF